MQKTVQFKNNDKALIFVRALLRFSIKSNNYRKAKYYAKKIPQKTIREISCYSMATFQLYRWLKQVRHKGLKMFKGLKRF